jgi:DNA-directed RNA polymerase specialized sigma24 family protein
MPKDRELVERVFFAGESQTQVARHFRVSGAAISKRMMRIVARGRVALDSHSTSVLLQ